MFNLLALFILVDTSRSCIAFAVMHAGVHLAPAKINLWSEFLKLGVAAICHYRASLPRYIDHLPGWQSSDENQGRFDWLSSLLPRDPESESIQWRLFFMSAIPAALYLLNNILYLAGLRLCTPALLQAALQLKLPLTAILHLVVFRRQRCVGAWISLVILTAGVLGLHATLPETDLQAGIAIWAGPALGAVMAVISSITAITSEFIIKTPQPFWTLQIWLYGWGAIFAATVICLGVDGPAPASRVDERLALLGEMAVVLIVATTGLVVALILRKSDNLVKLVGSSATIVTSFLLEPLIDSGRKEHAADVKATIAIIIIASSTWAYNVYKEVPVQGSIHLTSPKLESAPRSRMPTLEAKERISQECSGSSDQSFSSSDGEKS